MCRGNTGSAGQIPGVVNRRTVARGAEQPDDTPIAFAAPAVRRLVRVPRDRGAQVLPVS